MNQLVQAYLAMTEQPAVSGFEHLAMFDLRDQIENDKAILTQSDSKVLAVADQQLLDQAYLFVAALETMVDLAQERLRHNPPATHWWWYLDVLMQLPSFGSNGKGEHAVAPSVIYA